LASDIKGGTWTEGVEDRVLRKIFGSKKNGMVRGLRKLPNEELHNVKIAIFWDATPCGSCKNRCFRDKCRLHNQGVLSP
jgi:ribosomal protein L1